MEQRAEVAKQYAQNGNTVKAKEIALAVLSELPAYMQAATQMLDGPHLVNTVQPVMTALVLAGDRERALTELREIERFARNEGRNLTSFLGASLGILHLARIYYEIGEDAKADTLVDAAIKENRSERHPSWSKPFAIAYAKCASGKPNCLDALLRFSDEMVDREAGERILGWAIEARRLDNTADVVGRKFNIADAWLLNYGKLSLEIIADDEDQAAKTLASLIEKERTSVNRIPLLRCIFLLRLAVAMERRDLAIEAVKVILSRDFGDQLAVSATGRDWERQSANRSMMLAESAAILAQLH